MSFPEHSTEPDALKVPLPPEIAAEIAATIDQIRAEVKRLTAPIKEDKTRRMTDETRGILKFLEKTTEELSAVLAEGLTVEFGIEKPDIVINKLRLYFKEATRVQLEIDSIRHPNFPRRALYFLRMKKTNEVDVDLETADLSAPIALPAQKQSKLDLLGNLKEFKDTLPEKNHCQIVLLDCFIDACKKDKSFSAKYALKVARQKYGQKEASLPDMKGGLRRLSKDINQDPEEYGFSIINNSEEGLWQAVPVAKKATLVEGKAEVEGGAKVAEEEDKSPVQPEIALRARIADAARHIVHDITLTTQQVEFLCDHLADVSAQGKWTSTTRITNLKAAKKLGITKHKVEIFRMKLGRILAREDGKKALGFAFEKSGPEAFRFKLTEPYQKTLDTYRYQAGIYPEKIPELTFEENYFTRTLGTWLLGFTGTDSYTPKVVEMFVKAARAGNGVTGERISKEVGISIEQVATSITTLNRAIKSHQWKIEIGMAKRSNYYIKTKNDRDESPKYNMTPNRLLVEKILIEHQDGPNAITIDADRIAVIIARMKALGKGFNIASMLYAQATVVLKKSRELNVNLTSKEVFDILAEIVSDRMKAAERVADSPRHFAAFSPEIKFVFDSLREKASSGKMFTRKQLLEEVQAVAPDITAERYQLLSNAIKNLNLNEPMLLGYEVTKLANNNFIVRATSPYSRAEVPYLKAYATYPQPINDPTFRFSRSIYDKAIEMILGQGKDRRTSIFMCALFELSKCSENRQSISRRLLAKRMKLELSEMGGALQMIREILRTDPNIPFVLKEGSQKTLYLETIGGNDDVPVKKRNVKKKKSVSDRLRELKRRSRKRRKQDTDEQPDPDATAVESTSDSDPTDIPEILEATHDELIAADRFQEDPQKIIVDVDFD